MFTAAGSTQGTAGCNTARNIVSTPPCPSSPVSLPATVSFYNFYLIVVLGLRPTGIAILSLGQRTNLGWLRRMGSNKGFDKMSRLLTRKVGRCLGQCTANRNTKRTEGYERNIG